MDFGVTQFSHERSRPERGARVRGKRVVPSVSGGCSGFTEGNKNTLHPGVHPGPREGREWWPRQRLSALELGFGPQLRDVRWPAGHSSTQGQSSAVSSTLGHGRARDILSAKDKAQKEQSILVPCSELYRVYPT